MAYQNPYSNYEEPKDGSAGGFTTPANVINGDVSGKDIFTGKVAFDDISKMNAPNYNTFSAQAYQANPNAGVIGNQSTTAFDAMGNAVQGRAAPTMNAATMDLGAQNQIRGDQRALITGLQQRAAGRTPSIAEMQLKRGLDQSIAAQRAQAASARGISPGMAQRLASQGILQAQTDTNQQAAVLRAQEQIAAEQQLGQILAGARGQDLSVAGQQAGFNQQANQANLGAALTMQQQNDRMTEFYMSQGFSRDQAAQMAAMQMEQLNANNFNAAQAINADIAKQNAEAEAKSQSGMLGMAGNLVGGIMQMSDERLKTDVAEIGGDDLDEFIRSAKPVSYDYVEREYLPKGRQFGVMAQDIERSKVGKAIVVDTKQGKALDVARGYGAVLAAMRRLDERLAKVEPTKKGKAA